MKKCTGSKESKEEFDFGKNKSQKDGLNNECKSCCSDRAKKHYTNNKEFVNADNKKRYNENKEERCKQQREYSLANPDTVKNTDLVRRYGITLVQYREMLQEQNSCCAICNKPETRTRNGKLTMLSVDHNHTTGEVRGLLCNKCNTLIGYANEDAKILEASLKYLERYKHMKSLGEI